MEEDPGTSLNEEEYYGPSLSTDRLRILVVGDPESLAESAEFLKSLDRIGYSIAKLETVSDLFMNGAQGVNQIRSNAQLAEEDPPPDLIIQTTDNPELLRRIIPQIPPHVGILDPVALKIVKELTEVSESRLAAMLSRLKSMALIKEVLMSEPGISLMVVDEDLEVLEMNNAIIERIKMPGKDCIGKPCHLVLNRGMKPCRCRGDHCVAQEALRAGRAVHTIRNEDKFGGSGKYFSISAYPLGTDERGKGNVLIVWKDITRDMTQVLDERARDMQETFFETLKKDKMVALGQLAAAAVHEINNPVQGILTFAKLMRQSFDKESLAPDEMAKFRSYLDLMAAESARCGQILRNLLSFARLGNLEKTTFDFVRIVEEVVMLTRHRLALQGVEIHTNIAPDLLPLFGDRGQLKQALLNLLMNSMDAMPDGGAVTVSVEMDQHRDHLKIRVRDTGIGIPKHLQSTVWEPFITTKEVGKGVGLGLSVVYGIVTQHGGSIDMHSEENQGTVFTLSLPIHGQNQETRED